MIAVDQGHHRRSEQDVALLSSHGSDIDQTLDVVQVLNGLFKFLMECLQFFQEGDLKNIFGMDQCQHDFVAPELFPKSVILQQCGIIFFKKRFSSSIKLD